MGAERRYLPVHLQSMFEGTPPENYRDGVVEFRIPSLGNPTSGKVRDTYSIRGNMLILGTTDRQSAFDHMIGTTPGKGIILTKLSEWWFYQTKDIIPNHLLAVPYHNVMIVREAEQRLPVEVVVRGYMAESATSTSLIYHYRRGDLQEAYGLELPEGLAPNQKLRSAVVTPTTKADEGHDQELTDEKARALVDAQFGEGTWEKVHETALALYERGHSIALERGLILADTKYEFGVDRQGNLMLIDELHTPDSSRIWLAATYESQMAQGQPPESFDKEILRRWLDQQGFRGEGPVPVVPQEIIAAMTEAYLTPFNMLTGSTVTPETLLNVSQDPVLIQHEVMKAIARLGCGVS